MQVACLTLLTSTRIHSFDVILGTESPIHDGSLLLDPNLRFHKNFYLMFGIILL